MNFKVVSPILGFESISEISFSTIDDFFSKLEKEGIAFTLIDPSRLRTYSFEIPLFYKNLLKIEEGDDVKVYNTMIVHTPIEKSLINFAAPLILNHSKMLLAQVALDSATYPEFGIAETISTYL